MTENIDELNVHPQDWLMDFAKRESQPDILSKVAEHQAVGDWVMGTVQSVYEDVTFTMHGREMTQHMLEVLTDDGITCYVRQGQAGFWQPDDRAFVTMIDDRVPVKIYQRLQIENSKREDVAHIDYGEYVIIGEISGAEYIIGQEFDREFRNQNSWTHKELRGTVKSIYEPKRNYYVGNGEYVDTRRIFVEYEGMTVVIPLTAFTHKAKSRLQKVHDYVKVGDPVYFYVTGVSRLPVTATMRERNPDMSLDGDYYFYTITGSAIHREITPEEAISRLIKSKASATRAYITNMDISGYFVELLDAPGVTFKMRPSGNGKVKPSPRDVENHAIVAVKLKKLKDEKDDRGFYKGHVEYIRTN